MEKFEPSSYPRPQALESPTSLLRRLVGLLGYSSISEINDHLSASYNNSLYAHLFCGSDLAIRLKHTPLLAKEGYGQSYFKIVGTTGRRNCQIYGTPVPVKLIDKQTLRVCSDCLSEGSHYTVLAHFNFLDYCPIHKREVIRKCPRCETPIRWSNTLSNHCSCGHSYQYFGSTRVHVDHGEVLREKMRAQCPIFFSNLRRILIALRHDQHEHRNDRIKLLDIAILLLQSPEEGVKQYLRFTQNTYDLHIKRVALAPLCKLGIASIERAASDELMIPPTKNRTRSILGAANNSPQAHYLDHSQTCVALNVSSSFLKKLSEKGILRRQALQKNMWQSQEIESLLITLANLKDDPCGDTSKPNSPLVGGKTSFFNLVEIYTLQALPVLSADLTQGLRGFTLNHAHTPDGAQQSHQLIDINSAAKMAGTYPDALRRVVKAKLLNVDHPRPHRNSAYLFKPQRIREFCIKYVFITELSAKWNQPRTILSAKLNHLNITPISGPRIDGGLIPVYKRNDIGDLDEGTLNSTQSIPTATGRKKGDPKKYDSTQWVTTHDICSHFDVSPLEVSKLASKELIEEGVPEGREADNFRYFTAKSFRKLALKVQRSITLVEFLKVICREKKYLQRVFLRTGYLKPIQVGCEYYFSKSDVKKAIKFTNTYMTVSEATQYLGVDKTFFANQEKFGKLDFVLRSECPIARNIRLVKVSTIKSLRKNIT